MNPLWQGKERAITDQEMWNFQGIAKPRTASRYTVEGAKIILPVPEDKSKDEIAENVQLSKALSNTIVVSLISKPHVLRKCYATLVADSSHRFFQYPLSALRQNGSGQNPSSGRADRDLCCFSSCQRHSLFSACAQKLAS